jgi:hypothetical protein
MDKTKTKEMATWTGDIDENTTTGYGPYFA